MSTSFVLFISLWFSLSFGQQYYDPTLCSSDENYPGTRYICVPSKPPCRTFLAYHANDQFATVSDIAGLFKLDPDVLLSINSKVTAPSQILEPGHEVIVPITCTCTNEGFSQANFTYTASESTTLSSVSCTVFEGLAKHRTLAEANDHLPLGHDVPAGTALRVPIKCACPDFNSTGNGVKYLVTYPFITRDDTTKVSKKFNVSVEEIWRSNHLDSTTTVYPNTTILVPLKDKPFINFKIPNSDLPAPQFLPTVPMGKGPKRISQLKKAYIAGSLVSFTLIVTLLIASCMYVKHLKKCKEEEICFLTRKLSSLNSNSTPFSEPPTRSSTNSCLSPDLLAGIKYSLCTYTVEDLSKATNNFSQDSVIGSSLYKGVVFDHGEVMIQRTRFEHTRHIIDVHSKINHVNIVKLHGVCYSDQVDHCKWSNYLIFEHPSNGSLRDCLTGSSPSLHWLRRMQIAFDIATGLHYLHYSVIPGYTHLINMNSKNIFLTSNWRAKITVFGTMEGSGDLTGWVAPEDVAPEDVAHGVVSEKVDIFAFGVILLELISGKETGKGKLTKESIMFLGGEGNEGGCFDNLRNLVDPSLKDNYSLADALCLSVLAGSCIEDDPMHRPSMNDVLKILARMV